MGEKLDRRSRKLLETFRECQYSDIIGVGNILGVNDNQEFDDYLTDIVIKFQELNRATQKGMLKMIQDVAKANKEMTSNPNLIKKLSPEELTELQEKKDELKAAKSTTARTPVKPGESHLMNTLRGMEE